MPTLTDDERNVALSVVSKLEPGELEYAESLLLPRQWWLRRRNAIGFGIEPAVELVSPYAFLATMWVLGVVTREVEEVFRERFKRATRELLGTKAARVAAEPPLRPPWPLELALLESYVGELAHELGLSKKRARMLARVVVAEIAARVERGRQ